MNKILTPLNKMAHLDDLIKAGAEEFYLGFRDEKWDNEFSEFREINRMSGFKDGANIYTLKDALDGIKTIKEKGKKVYIAINSSSYSAKELERIKYYFRLIKDAGADGVIVSTIKEVEYATEIGLESVASTLTGIYNDLISKYYKKAGCFHQVLPRDLSVDEIESIVKKNPDVKYEVFMMRNGCQFSDSHCLGFHRKEYGSTCGMLKRLTEEIHSTRKDFKGRNEVEYNNILYKVFYHITASCGLCALYRFTKMGIYSYKIVGRNDDPKEIMDDVYTINKNIEIALNSNSEEEFLEKMMFPANSYNGCKKGLGCYYPEIRFK